MSQKSTPESEASFEQSLEQLQEIVRQLEDGTLGLDESMTQFEEGVKLLKQCYAVLDRTEQRIELLTRLDDDGQPVLEPFDNTGTAETKDTNKTKAGRRKRTTKTEEDDSGLF